MVLGDEELSENTQLYEVVIERLEESKRRTKPDTQKKAVYIEKEKKKAQEMRKKATEKFEETRKRKKPDEVTLRIKTKQKV